MKCLEGIICHWELVVRGNFTIHVNTACVLWMLIKWLAVAENYKMPHYMYIDGFMITKECVSCFYRQLEESTMSEIDAKDTNTGESEKTETTPVAEVSEMDSELDRYKWPHIRPVKHVHTCVIGPRNINLGNILLVMSQISCLIAGHLYFFVIIRTMPWLSMPLFIIDLTFP